MSMSGNRYIPALSFRRLTPLYDPLLRWGMQEERFKRAFIHQAHIQPGQRVLDLGCGTGTLTLLIKQTQPQATVIGLDGDADILAIARHKAHKAGASVDWMQGMAYALPYDVDSYDRAVTSLVLHHLTTENKQRTLAELYRVLRPGGEVHVLDFGRPHSAYGRLLMRLLRHLEEVADNLDGRLPGMFMAAGFVDVEETARFVTVVGELVLNRMSKPAA